MSTITWYVHLNFNSIKVQLKLAGARALGGGRIFQFHKGTIKTWGAPEGRMGARISIP